MSAWTPDAEKAPYVTVVKMNGVYRVVKMSWSAEWDSFIATFTLAPQRRYADAVREAEYTAGKLELEVRL